VFFGAQMPHQPLASEPGRDSPTVGISVHPGESRRGVRAVTSLRAHFVERERKPLGAKAASPCDMPA
jgi:hypothetical protein